MSKPEKEKKIVESHKDQNIRFIIILILAAVVVLAVYIRLTNQSRNSNQQAEENLTETEILKMYDLTNQYPKTVRDVVKMHCRYFKCMYNEELEEEEYRTLNSQVRQLYAQELLNENVESEQFADLLTEVEDFHTANKIFISYTIDAEENVQYSEVDGVEYAIVFVNYNIKEGTVTDSQQEEYLLIKENGQWKILGWQGVTLEDDTTEE